MSELKWAIEYLGLAKIQGRRQDFAAMVDEVRGVLEALSDANEGRTDAPDAGDQKLQRLIDSIQVVGGKACWDCSAMYDVRDALAARSTPKQGEADIVQLVGVKADGTEHFVGEATMPPKMKAREIVREMFGHFDEEAGDDGAMAFWCCEQLIEWMGATLPTFHASPSVEPATPTDKESLTVAPPQQVEPGWVRVADRQLG